MHPVRQENLPFVGSSHEFIGAEQGDTSASVFLFHGKPVSRPLLQCPDQRRRRSVVKRDGYAKALPNIVHESGPEAGDTSASLVAHARIDDSRRAGIQ